MIDVDYGYVKVHLADIMKKQNVSISKLAYRAEMQRTQLKAYMKQDIVRVDLEWIWLLFPDCAMHFSVI